MTPATETAALGALATVVGDFAFLTPLGPGGLLAQADQELAIAVAFTGSASGTLTLVLGWGVPQALAANLAPPEDGGAPCAEDVLEAAKELANVLAGNLLALAHGAEAEFRLGSPVVAPAADPDHPAHLRLGLALAEGALMVTIA